MSSDRLLLQGLEDLQPLRTVGKNISWPQSPTGRGWLWKWVSHHPDPNPRDSPGLGMATELPPPRALQLHFADLVSNLGFLLWPLHFLFSIWSPSFSQTALDFQPWLGQPSPLYSWAPRRTYKRLHKSLMLFTKCFQFSALNLPNE